MKLRLKHYRIRQGLTQEQLSQQIGITEHALNRIEKGRTTPRPNTLKKIADALGVSIDDLIIEEDKAILQVVP